MAKPAPPTSWVGESGVRNSGCCSSSALQSAKQLVELRVGDDRRVPDVVAELVSAHLVGEFLPATTHVGGGGFLGLFGQCRLGVRGCLGAHPGRLTEQPDNGARARVVAGQPVYSTKVAMPPFRW